MLLRKQQTVYHNEEKRPYNITLLGDDDGMTTTTRKTEGTYNSRTVTVRDIISSFSFPRHRRRTVVVAQQTTLHYRVFFSRGGFLDRTRIVQYVTYAYNYSPTYHITKL